MGNNLRFQVKTEEIPGEGGEHIMHAVIGAASAIDHICGDRVESEQGVHVEFEGGREGAEKQEENQNVTLAKEEAEIEALHD